MNEVFLMGKIVTGIEFGFIINSKYFSKVDFNLMLVDGKNIKINAYDEIADYIYSKLKQEDDVFIYGRLCKDRVIAIEIKSCKVISSNITKL